MFSVNGANGPESKTTRMFRPVRSYQITPFSTNSSDLHGYLLQTVLDATIELRSRSVPVDPALAATLATCPPSGKLCPSYASVTHFNGRLLGFYV